MDAICVTFHSIDAFEEYLQALPDSTVLTLVVRLSGPWQSSKEASACMEASLLAILSCPRLKRSAILGFKDPHDEAYHDLEVIKDENWWKEGLEQQRMTMGEYQQSIKIPAMAMEVKKKLDYFLVENCQVSEALAVLLGKDRCQPWPLALLEEDNVDEEEKE